MSIALVVLLAGCAGSTGGAGGDVEAAGAAGSARLAVADPEVSQLLDNSCFDCHSDRSASSWNARLAPSYLFAAGKARRALDFSEWQRYPAEQRQAELASIAEALRNGSMPPGDYDFVHPAARLNAEQKQALLDWVSAQMPAKP